VFLLQLFLVVIWQMAMQSLLVQDSDALRCCLLKS
jgi:hypothetical protein